MLIPSDYKELLKTLNAHKVRYLIVGAYAVIYYTEPRYTKDIDIWIEPELKNAQRLYRALKEFGAPLRGINVGDFVNKDLVYQIGVTPLRVDIIMDIPGIIFDRAWEKKELTSFAGVKANIIGINDLIRAKKSTKRKVDILDAESLRQGLKLKKKR